MITTALIIIIIVGIAFLLVLRALLGVLLTRFLIKTFLDEENK